MNAIIRINGENVTDGAILNETRLNTDSSRHITTGSISLHGDVPGETAVWGEAVWGESYWAIDVNALDFVTIIDGVDMETKLFEGQIFALNLSQTDGEPPTKYVVELNDYSSWLDRSVCWDTNFEVTFPTSDSALIKALVARFCYQIRTDLYVETLIPVLNAYDWQGKTLRAVLDELAALAMAEWRVDFSTNLHYTSAANAPAAPFELSTSPDFLTSFPVRVDSFKRDFTNPVNRCFVRGGYIPGTAIPAIAEFSDPVSMQEFGEFSAAVVDDSITDPFDAQLRAKTTVLKYAWPIEQGSFTIWKDGLQVGMKVRIVEESLGIDGDYVIRSLSMTWKDQFTVEYQANFGAAQADLESFLRLLDSRTKWRTSNPTNGIPLPGSVTDDSIASSGLHEQSIKSVNGGVITIGSIQADKIDSVSGQSVLIGSIDATKIGSVNGQSLLIGSVDADKIGSINGGTIIQGTVTADKIESVNAQSITVGKLAADQIGSINAATITVGVIASDQLADSIVDDLAKYSQKLRPVPTLRAGELPVLPHADYPPGTIFFYEPNGAFYKINAAGTGWDYSGTDPDVLGQFRYYQIGKIEAKSITGLIVAAQIHKITAGQITGEIQAEQIGNINASTITSGFISADRINTINASAIQAGAITADKIASINAQSITIGKLRADQIQEIYANQITTTIQGSQIAAIRAETITINKIGSGQIGSVDAGTITVGKINSDQLNSTEIMVGGGGNKPGKLSVRDGSNVTVAELGLMTGGSYGGWFKVFGAGGTGYASAKVYTDTTGALFVKDADVNITASGSTIKMSTTTFDSTYNSLAVEVTSGAGATGDKAKLVSRGLVVWYGANYAVTVNRMPSSPTCGEVVVYNGGVLKIQLDGSTGRCRADGGFQYGAYTGTPSATFTGVDGASMTINGGIVTNVGARTVSPLYSGQLNFRNGANTGWYECYFENGLLKSALARS